MDTGTNEADILKSLALVAASAELHITWALSLLGASIAMVVGTSHVSPYEKSWRGMYLLFIPGWVLLSVSIYYGDLVVRGHLSSLFVRKEMHKKIFEAMNDNFLWQQNTLIASVAFFSVWLIVYLLWWIYIRKPTTTNPENKNET